MGTHYKQAFGCAPEVISTLGAFTNRVKLLPEESAVDSNSFAKRKVYNGCKPAQFFLNQEK